MREALGDRLAEDAEELVLARRVSAEGRTRAYLGGRSATAADLRDAGAALLSFYGQHEHRKLMLASSQLEILDGFAGPEQAARRTAFRRAYRPRARAAARLGELRERAGARDRELDLLEWELAEIERAEPSEDEEASLEAERGRLRHVESLRAAVGRPASARWPAATRTVAAPRWRWRRPRRRSRRSAGWTRSSTRWPAACARSRSRPRTSSHELHRYAEGIDAAPGRLDEVEERLALLDRLKRKHGGTIAAVLAYAAACRARRDELAGAEEAIEDAERELAAARAELRERARRAHAAREAAGVALAEAVRRALGGAGDGGRRVHGRAHPARGLRPDRGPTRSSS